ncbi:MAG: GspMb/PilO family protein, partial [Gemmatimonadaceae bacterium]
PSLPVAGPGSMKGIQGLSARDRRVLFWGVVVIALILLTGRGVPRLRVWASARSAEVDALALQVQRARASVDGGSSNQRIAQQATLKLARYDSAMLGGRVPTTAGAQLAEVLAESAEATETQLGAVQLSSDSTRMRLGHVTARVEVTGDLEAIALFLDALEEGPELLAVRELDLAPDGSVSAPTQPERLKAQILVEGVYRAADTKRGSP